MLVLGSGNHEGPISAGFELLRNLGLWHVSPAVKNNRLLSSLGRKTYTAFSELHTEGVMIQPTLAKTHSEGVRVHASFGFEHIVVHQL